MLVTAKRSRNYAPSIQRATEQVPEAELISITIGNWQVWSKLS